MIDEQAVEQKILDILSCLSDDESKCVSEIYLEIREIVQTSKTLNAVIASMHKAGLVAISSIESDDCSHSEPCISLTQGARQVLKKV
jgi:hypothetical protein